MDTYTLAKALHVTAIIIWLGGMLLNGVLLSYFAKDTGLARTQLAGWIQRWDFRVTLPSMVLAWLFGGIVMVMGGWFPDAWLMIKLFLVLVVSAIHGMQSGRIRRLAEPGQAEPLPSVLKHSTELAIAAVLVIVVLVIVKPF
ncbi:MAG: CopD family protein [Hyphomicrobiaceae bacterium]|nr:CopD family protein [Hyphomicrobiaceae bacterium]